MQSKEIGQKSLVSTLPTVPSGYHYSWVQIQVPQDLISVLAITKNIISSIYKLK